MRQSNLLVYLPIGRDVGKLHYLVDRLVDVSVDDTDVAGVPSSL